MSKYLKFPKIENSLHRPELERDACGVGVVAHIKGERSYRVLRLGLDSVSNVTHRGAVNSDGKTGDGAGVMTHIPYKILRPVVAELGGTLESDADLAVGVFFLPADRSDDQVKAKVIAEGVLRRRGFGIIGWRKVPVNPGALGQLALDTMPVILHLLLTRPTGLDDEAFERRLYLGRREIEDLANGEQIRGFYIPSLSSRLINYKGFMVATTVEEFYLDLVNEDFETAVCLYHQRFSTNTFPTWALAQPFRMLCHNGEINTVRGNRNWFRARIGQFQSEIWGEDLKFLYNAIDPHGSDSASLDSALELLVLSGRSVPHAMSMLVPPAWRIDPFTSEAVEDFFRYHSCFSEPWDGPAALAFSDGRTVAACLDRNGLRPARYKITTDGIFSLGSEAGTCYLPDDMIEKKGRLGPGEMIVIDTIKGEVIFNEQIKEQLAAQQPYGQWLRENQIQLSDIVSAKPLVEPDPAHDPLTLSQLQVANGLSQEELDMVFTPMAATGQEAIYSMGDDAALPILSRQPKVLFTYFKQLFAQVTNPPIDPIREFLVMSLEADLGPERNILVEEPGHARVVHLPSPLLFTHQLEALKGNDLLPAKTIDMTWPLLSGPGGLSDALESLCEKAAAAVMGGAKILILSDRLINHERVGIPSLLAVGAVHHHLSQKKMRMRTSLIIDTGEARDTHHVACLIGFGATTVCPWLAHETVREIAEKNIKNQFDGITVEKALVKYHSALEKGLLKIMSKMGISVLNSYQGAQIFEAVGISEKVVEQCFRGTPSQISGIGFFEIGAESIARHTAGFANAVPNARGELDLGDPGYFRFRRDGEVHAVSGGVIKNFHTFVKSGEADDYEKYLEELRLNQPNALHDLFELVPNDQGPIPLNEVESIESVRKRFTTAAMSLGAIGPEAHETLAIAMNRIGGKSDSGEGGEDPRRFKPYANGDWGNSKIKQIASGRFGVSAAYLMSAEELEIKIAQGAKPGEGGQLPGFKVTDLIARLRHSTPGVTLISPPPHHDIYSIEDLAQLIYDLKQINPRARVCVKLVSSAGIGTVAAGVAKAHADVILISGHVGGTAASPQTSIKYAGTPWEMGLSEVNQVLTLNGLRHRVKLRTDGGLKTGRDIVIAAILGAEEYGIGTLSLVAMGCIMVRQCHSNTCPVGVCTQDDALRQKFVGTPEKVINLMSFIAEEVREILAKLGVRSLDDVIGRTELLRQVSRGAEHLDDLDLNPILAKVDAPDHMRRFGIAGHRNPVPDSLDVDMIRDAEQLFSRGERMQLTYAVRNTHRAVGTRLSSEITRKFGMTGLAPGHVQIRLRGSAGQSLGAFAVQGIRLEVFGEANDYVGKGLSGATIVVRPMVSSPLVSQDNAIIGNTVLYGATAGRLFAAGRAGERFAVRNSGAFVVVEGCGANGCEYMTGGVAVVLGRTGDNFAAGMSGGMAFVYDATGDFPRRVNPESVLLNRLASAHWEAVVHDLISEHARETGSKWSAGLISEWDRTRTRIWQICPREMVSRLAHPLDDSAVPVAAE